MRRFFNVLSPLGKRTPFVDRSVAYESGETKNEASEDMEDMEDFYYGKLASVCQTYSIGYLGW